MIEKKPLYLVLQSNGTLPSILQLRTNIDHLESYRFEMKAGGDYVLKIPEPIITIAIGDSIELFNLAQRMFGRVATENLYFAYNWKEIGGFTYAYQLR